MLYTKRSVTIDQKNYDFTNQAGAVLIAYSQITKL